MPVQIWCVGMGGIGTGVSPQTGSISSRWRLSDTQNRRRLRWSDEERSRDSMNSRSAVSSLSVVLAAAVISAWTAPGWSTWHTFTAADGLAGRSVSSILEDPSETLWFGTDQGVSRYDGFTWRTFLGGHFIWSMLEDRSGTF